MPTAPIVLKARRLLKSLLVRRRETPVAATRQLTPTTTLLNCCPCCGAKHFGYETVLWSALIEAWELSPSEVEYINRQQGVRCCGCSSNLRSMALAKALVSTYSEKSTTLTSLIKSPAKLPDSLLEINKAGKLTQFLCEFPGYKLVEYPEVDMQCLSIPSESVSAIVHSDTLEHVPEPVTGLSECYRVLRPGGYLFYTVPIIIGRLTRSRRGLPPSYHGSSSNPEDCLVHTEYGADAWCQPLQVGFSVASIYCIEYPSALAMACRK